MRRRIALAAAAGLAHAVAAQPNSVLNGPHNLSAGGPGTIRAQSENEVCIFCHAPHNASLVRPLWNRSMPPDAYSIYTSRALDALPGQPTGTSKMCLSCHDGTIALGAVISRGMPIAMAGGVTTIPTGRGNIGTDLRDDHPISFRFDSALAARDPHLRSPASLPDTVRLDSNAELQCTTCHDAHNNSFGDFLVVQNAASQLCQTCHNVGTTTISAHSTCDSCHQTHTAPSGPYILKAATIGQTCLRCHNGTVSGAANIDADMHKAYTHDTQSPVDPPDPQNQHTTCTSCHDPHTMSPGAAQPPALHPNFGLIDGVNASGSPVSTASAEYEVCFKCHADGADIQSSISRVIVQNNTRLEFNPGAISYHPVQAPGRNTDMPSLRPGWTTSSLVRCSDCHGSDTGDAAGGSGPNGTHGSNSPPLLSARYETADFTSESAAAYALCYRCHDRDNILSENSSSFKYHRRHIVEERTPCSACHDAHGISSAQGRTSENSHLINFSTRIVRPNSQGQLKFNDLGRFTGQCSLSCHGEEHSNEGY